MDEGQKTLKKILGICKKEPTPELEASFDSLSPAMAGLNLEESLPAYSATSSLHGRGTTQLLADPNPFAQQQTAWAPAFAEAGSSSVPSQVEPCMAPKSIWICRSCRLRTKYSGNLFLNVGFITRLLCEMKNSGWQALGMQCG